MRARTGLRPPFPDRNTPVLAANAGRNLLADDTRIARWRSARDQLWRLLDPLVRSSARVAVIGAGNGHDLPLSRLAARAGQVTLIDIDRAAPRRARRRLPTGLRRKVCVLEHDVTAGAAGRIIRGTARGQLPDPVLIPEAQLPHAPYDLVVGDLLYSQLLYPAMLDLGICDARRRTVLDRVGPTVVRGVVARLHASAPHGRVVHLHDPLGWWPGHAQPVALAEILDAARCDVAQAMTLVARGHGPADADPRSALVHFAIPIRATALWRWPFAEQTDYLVCASVAGAPLRPDGAERQSSRW
jgi:hypothetical protein